jgi:ketosteroid isomerase-like protein
MVRNVDTAAFALAVLCCATSANAASKEEQVLLRLEAQYTKSLLAHDCKALSAMYAPEDLFRSPAGKILTKADLDEGCNAKIYVVTSYVSHDLSAHAVGDTGYVFGANDENSTVDGKNSSGTYRWIDVWHKRNGKWQLVAGQSELVTK